MQFNVLRDPWVPLDRDGAVEHASVAEILCGEKDAPDLIHPRDDVRFFSRMLLSALAQALFTPENRRGLLNRLDQPMSRKEFEERVAPVEQDFELVGTPERAGFMQEPSGAAELVGADPDSLAANDTISVLIDAPRGTKHLLFQKPHGSTMALCARCIGPVLFGLHTWAPSDGKSSFGLSGKNVGLVGANATMSMVMLGSVRRTIWANVLHRETIEGGGHGYARDPKRAWRQLRQVGRKDALGLVEGLFWQPRALHLVPAAQGPCSACAELGPLLEARAFRSKSGIKETSFWHPLVPRKKNERPFVVLSSKPAWTGLAELLGAFAGDDPRIAGSPVVTQWFESLRRPAQALALFGYRFVKNGKLESRTSEEFSLPRSSGIDPALAGEVRSLLVDAEAALGFLRQYLKQAHSSRGGGIKGRRDGYWAADAEACFWQETEATFWTTYRALLSNSLSSSLPYRQALERAALRLFDEHTRASIDDPSRIDVIVRARRKLRFRLTELVDHRAPASTSKGAGARPAPTAKSNQRRTRAATPAR